MIQQIRPYIHTFLLKMKETSQYKFNYMSTLLYASISTIIYAMLSFALFGSSGQINPKYLLCYYGLIALVADAISPAQYVAHKMMTDITTGAIAVHLVRPYSYLGTMYAGYLGECLPKVLFNLLFAACAQLYLLGTVYPLLIIVGGIACIQGFSILFFIQALIGCMTIWLRDITRVRDVIFNLLLLLGGRLIPVEYLFRGLKHIVIYTPIAYVYDAPLRLFLGSTSVFALLAQLVWIVLLGVACGLIFHFHVRRCIEMGG